MEMFSKEKLTMLWGEYGMNFLLILLLALLLLLLFSHYRRMGERKALFRINEQEEAKEVKRRERNPYKLLRKSIHLAFMFNPNQRKEDFIYYGIIAAESIIFVGLLVTGKYLLAIIFTIVFHLLAVKVISIYTKNIHEHIQEELPSAIRHFIKVMTKTNDLRTVTYEAGKSTKEPLRSEFLDATRRMTNESPEKVLMDLADRLQNPWIHSFVFILSSQQESSRKEDVITNLAILAEIIDAEEYIAEKAVTERKGLVIINSLLGSIAFLGFFATLIWVNGAYDYFFNTPVGTIVLVLGFTCLFLTFMVNVTLSKKTI